MRKAILQKRVGDALATAAMYGNIDGAHHKAWVIDQMVRELTGEKYDEFLQIAKHGLNGTENYDWDEGIAP